MAVGPGALAADPGGEFGDDLLRVLAEGGVDQEKPDEASSLGNLGGRPGKVRRQVMPPGRSRTIASISSGATPSWVVVMRALLLSCQGKIVSRTVARRSHAVALRDAVDRILHAQRL